MTNGNSFFDSEMEYIAQDLLSAHVCFAKKHTLLDQLQKLQNIKWHKHIKNQSIINF